MAFKRKHAGEAQLPVLKSLRGAETPVAPSNRNINGAGTRPRRLRNLTRKLFVNEIADHGEPLLLIRRENNMPPQSLEGMGSPTSRQFAFDGFEFDAGRMTEQRREADLVDPPAYESSGRESWLSTVDGSLSLDASWYSSFFAQTDGEQTTENLAQPEASVCCPKLGGLGDGQREIGEGQKPASSGSPSDEFSRETGHRFDTLLERPQRQLGVGDVPAVPVNTPSSSNASVAHVNLTPPVNFDFDFDTEYKGANIEHESSAPAQDAGGSPPDPNALFDWQPGAYGAITLDRAEKVRVQRERKPPTQATPTHTSSSHRVSTLTSSEANAFCFSDVSSIFAAEQEDSAAYELPDAFPAAGCSMNRALREQYSFSGFTQDFCVASSVHGSTMSDETVPNEAGFAHTQAILEAKTRAYEAKACLERERHEADIAALTARLASSNLDHSLQIPRPTSSPISQVRQCPRGGICTLPVAGGVVDRKRPAYPRGQGLYSKMNKQGTPAQREARDENRRIEETLRRRKNALLESHPELAEQLDAPGPLRSVARKRKMAGEEDMYSESTSRTSTGFGTPSMITLDDLMAARNKQRVVETKMDPAATSACQPDDDEVAPLQTKRRKLTSKSSSMPNLLVLSKKPSYADRAFGGARKALQNVKAAALNKFCSRKAGPPEQIPQLAPVHFTDFSFDANMGDLWETALNAWSAASEPQPTSEASTCTGESYGHKLATRFPLCNDNRQAQQPIRQPIQPPAVINPAMPTYRQYHPSRLRRQGPPQETLEEYRARTANSAPMTSLLTYPANTEPARTSVASSAMQDSGFQSFTHAAKAYKQAGWGNGAGGLLGPWAGYAARRPQVRGREQGDEGEMEIAMSGLRI